MWTAIFSFEIRYHFRQPLFYLVTFALSVLLFIAGTDNGASGRLHLNAPAVILEQLIKGIYLVLFLMTAFVASAAVRDFDQRTSELFFSKPISRFDYLTARFAGTMVVCTLPYLIGAIALATSTLMPGLDPTRVGPFQLAPYLFGLGLLIIPTLISLGAAFYALATWTRSSLETYVGVVAFLALSATAGWAASQLETPWIAQLLDPFGVTALSGAVKYWTVAELNSTTPDVGGMLLWNRVLWLALGLSAFGATVAAFDPSRTAPQSRRDRARAAGTDSTDTTSASETATSVLSRATARVFSRRTVLLQFTRQVSREATAVMMSFPFLGMLGLGLVVLIQAAGSVGDLFGMPVYPRTNLMLEALQGMYSVVLLLVVVLYSGDLIWKERALELSEITDSMPTPIGVYLGAKLTALLLVIAAYLFAGVATLIVFQLARGQSLELGLYARGVAIAAVYPALMLVLASFCHVVARNKLLGYGFVLLFIVIWDLLEELGFEHHLYRYASLPQAPYSDFNGYGPFLAPFGWYSAYWGFVALVIVGLCVLWWRSGTDDQWRSRWAEARARFRGAVRVAIGVGGVGAVALGAWIFHNTNVLNAYVPSTGAADRRASYERSYRKYQSIELPRIVAVRADVDIFPEGRSVEIRGSYRLQNKSSSPLRDIHVSVPERVRVNRLTLPAHDVVLADESHGYRILRLRTAIAPGETIDLGFDLSVEERGFVNNGTRTDVVENGTYFTKREFFPVIGYDAHRQLADADARRERDLEPAIRLADRDDVSARRTTPRAPDADRVEFESTISTSGDQIAVTSGELQREWTEKGRRYFQYRAELPITHHFAFASARYEVTRSDWNGVAIEIYHNPGHDKNVGRMMDAAKKSLALYAESFGPYQHRSLRIVEFPRYVRDGTAFPGLIALSESMGFNARLEGGVAVDYPFYVTAHEIAHQWWGQQVVGANVQGVGMLHETLAQHSALMVMEREFGEQGMRRVLTYEHDWYMRGRADERGAEAPLARVDGQDYVYYHKGTLAMNALRDAVGSAPLNLALARFLSRFALGWPPYSTTTDLLDEIRSTVPVESQHLIEDLFERITMFDNRVVAATSTARADGTFLVRVEIEAHKRQTDSAGVEREIPLDDWMDVAIYGEAAEGDARDAAGGGTALVVERRRVRGGAIAFEIAVGKPPARVVIDPHYKLSDRNRGDNVRAVVVGEQGSGR